MNRMTLFSLRHRDGDVFLDFPTGRRTPLWRSAAGIYLSFTEFTTITDAEFVGLKNYVRAFQDPDFLHALLFTLAFTIVTTILINVAAFFVAYMFTKACLLYTSDAADD